MPTSPLYDSTQARLAQALPEALASQVETLSLVLVGVVQSMSSQLAKIARALPLDTSQLAKEQRLRRFLDNERISQQVHYQPLLTKALSGLAGQRVQLLIDRVLLRNQHNILVVSIGFRRRSLPLVWQALPHRGCSGLADQKALIEQAAALLPPRVRVSVHGDSEFRSRSLFGWLRAQGYDAMVGVRGEVRIYGEGLADASGKPLVSFVPSLPEASNPKQRQAHRTSPVRYLKDVAVGEEERVGPVNLLAWWERDDDGKVVLHAVMTNLPATAQTRAYGRRRMWIETAFRDWQSGGFHLDRSGLVDTARLVQLLLVLAIAYLWLVSLGRWLVKRGYRYLIDDGNRQQWHFSLFQLGVGWKEHLSSYTRAIPVLFFLYT
jgi:Transposase DDE domain